MNIFDNYGDVILPALYNSLTNCITVGEMRRCNFKLEYDKSMAILRKRFDVNSLKDYVVSTQIGNGVETTVLFFKEQGVMISFYHQLVMESLDEKDYIKVNFQENMELDGIDNVQEGDLDIVENNFTFGAENPNEWKYKGEDIPVSYISGVTMYFNSKDRQVVDFLIELSKELNTVTLAYEKKSELNKIYDIVLNTQNKLTLAPNKLNTTNFLDIIDTNYNESLGIGIPELVRNLSDTQAGFYFFSGPPGTGKTSFILHLLSRVDIPKKFVYLSANAVNMFVSPEFLDFAKTQLKDCILIIEDAEELLRTRDQGTNLMATNILNMTSGMYGEMLSLKIIATVNTTDKVDEALFRKGRLKFKYEFDLLTVERANALLKLLDINAEVTKPTSLADIYNYNLNPDFGGSVVRKGIGF